MPQGAKSQIYSVYKPTEFMIQWACDIINIMKKTGIYGGEKMIAYSILMFAIAVLFLVFGIAIYKGNTKLIHDYHQTHIKESERQEYGRAFSKGMFAICATLIISGIVALFGEENAIIAASLTVLIAGLIVSFTILARVQKKYNGGFF